jgi:hypothetical protein
MLIAATVALSALLLFSVQPLFAKLVLPLLGGTPAVWAVSMCVFQALLCAGYAWAHLVVMRAPTWIGAALHCAVLTGAGLIALPIAAPLAATTPPTDPSGLWLATMVALGAGAPFFALAANAPLLQAWWHGATRGQDPYALYAASNAGSLIGLLAYPILFEPLLPLRAQTWAWSIGYALLVIAIIASALWRLSRGAAEPHPTTSAAATPTPRWSIRLAWIALAFVPSGLLVATTTFLTTDLASAPLLWVVPLALYLLTFIVVFREGRDGGGRIAQVFLPIGIAATFIALEWNTGWSWLASGIIGLATFTAAAFVCHRQLYAVRPDAAHLTQFYLWMSLGGGLGGIAAALLAPLIFTDVIEFPVLLAAALLAHPALRASTNRVSSIALGAALLVGGLTLASRGLALEPPTISALRLAAVAGFGVLAFAAIAYRPATTVIAALAALTAHLAMARPQASLHTTRSFFGTHRVMATPGGTFHLLLHGTTLHGAERRRDDQGRPLPRPEPLTYYHSSGALARALALARTNAPRDAKFSAGVVGLGTGAITCQAPTAAWTIFEIDPEVVRIARDPAYFRFLTTCAREADIILGDARLTLSRANAMRFDYLLIDAFSSDAIPTHLLTREALSLYLDRLAPRGILALHISNQTLDLVPVVAATLATLPGVAAVYAESLRGGGALASQAIVIAREAATLAPALTWPKARALERQATVRAWTDDHTDILGPLWSKLRQPAHAER